MMARPILSVMTIVAAIMVFVALYFTKAVFAPVACALFVIAIVWPLQRELQARLPKLLALAIVVAITVAVFVVFGSLIAWALGRVGRSLVADTARFQTLYEQATFWLEGHGVVVAAIWAEHFDVRWLMRIVQQVSGRINTTVMFWLVVMIYVILGLLEIDVVAKRIRGALERTSASTLLEGSAVIAAKFRRYLLIRTLMSLTTGMFVWGLAVLAGLPLAVEWGVIAFALNYIPFIGPFVATMLPTLFALAQFESWQAVIAMFVCLNVIQFVIGSYIEPRVAGSALAMSPFLVLFAVFFWTFLWGLFGAFIGVPITIAVLALCNQNPSTRWLAELFGSEPRKTEQSPS